MKIGVFAVVVFAVLGLGLAAKPVFPKDWSAKESSNLLEYQGQYSIQGGNYCCPKKSSCQVKVQASSGQHYFDYTNQRDRFDEFGGQTIVSFYNSTQKECLVVNNTCQSYCPLQGESLDPFSIYVNASDLGQKTINGKSYEDYQWKQVILGIIVMEITDVYVDTSVTPNIPFQEVDQLTPFGQHIGDSKTEWDMFTPGAQDPALFDIKGVADCPMSQNCNNNEAQMRRLRNKNFKTYLYYKSGGDKLYQ